MQQYESNKGIFKSLDWWTICMYIALICWGWASVCGASYDYNNPDIFSWGCNSGKQLVWVGTSVCLGGMLLLVEKRFYDTSAFFIYLVMVLLLLVTIFIAPDTKGSRSWLPIGGVKIQPAEFAKFAVALAIGKYMSKYTFDIHKWKEFAKVAGMILLPMLLIIAQKETGSALVYLAFFLVLYREGMTGAFLFTGFAMVVYFILGIRFGAEYIPDMPTSIGEFSVLLLTLLFTTGMVQVFCHDTATVKVLTFAGLGTSIVSFLFSAYVIPFNVSAVVLSIDILAVLYLIVMSLYSRMYKYATIAAFTVLSIGFLYASGYVFNNVLQSHQRVRIEELLGMKNDTRGSGYNVHQAKIAIGSGGLYGKGFLNGTQTKLKYVPEQDTDFIYCTVGEEGGFIGSVGVLTLYLIFILRLLHLSERQPDTLGRVYGYSVTCIFLFHLFINVGMVLGLTPVIGIPLPFFSYGGSSLWGFTLLLFIFLRMDAERNIKRQ